MSEITTDDIVHIANLARLEFSQQELDQFRGNLKRILDYISKLNQLDTNDVPPTSHVIPIRNVTKADEVIRRYDRQQILANAPSQEKGYFEVPKIIE